MAISRIGTAAGDGTTITIPAGHQNGDLIVIYAFRSAVTAPTLPAGWTSFLNGSGGASSYRMGWKVAGSSSETSGTWTNATGLICHVYRGQATNKAPVVALGTNSATSATVTYASSIPLACPGTSWVMGVAAIVTTTSTIETAPSGMTNRVNTVGATVEYAGHDSGGVYNNGTWPSTNVSVGVSAEWRAGVIEIKAEQLGPLNNYQFIKVGDGMGTGERIR